MLIVVNTNYGTILISINDVLRSYIVISVNSREENYGSEAMESVNINNVQYLQTNSESPCPSSAFGSNQAVDMEITLVNTSPTQENSDNDNGKLPDVVVEATICNNEDQIQETYFSIAIQVFIPFLIAGFGMVFAGLVLDKIQVMDVTISIFSPKNQFRC